MPETAANDNARIAVYICYCGGNISDAVDCEMVATALRDLPNVVITRTDMSMCSDAGQAIIEEDIRELGVNRVVVGACAPSLHERTFRGTVARAGLNPYLYHHVGLREQDSWVHQSNPQKATEKAIRLMMAGIAKARLLEPLEPFTLDAEQHALVIGGGFAGLRSAWDIARRGIRVTLIEKSPFLGGHMAQLETTFPAGEDARTALHSLIERVVAHPLITVHTGSELIGVSGYVGSFQVEITQQTRGVSEDFIHFEKAAAACPVEVPDEFNYGLTTRKALYRAYPGAYPNLPAIDWAHCDGCGECLNVNGAGLDLENKPKTFELNVGAFVVATGFRPYEPRQGEYGYDEYPEVITLPQMIRLLALTGKSETLTWKGRKIDNVALIHCVGSREIPGVHEPQPDGQVNDYCSRVCCTATLHLTNDLRERYPQLNIFDIHEDVRTYGRGHEDYYTEAAANRVRFLRFHGNERPDVLPTSKGDDSPLLIRVKDHLTWGEELDVPADLVVLATGILPNPVDDIINLLKISAGTDRFLLEVHPKLQPVETSVPGVILAGTAQGPMNIQEASAAASAAAAKVAVLLGQGTVELEPFVAHVNHVLCDGTGQCVDICAYEDAITLQTVSANGHTSQKAVVTPANCVGCGVCVSACPNRAIDVQGWTLAQYEAMVDAIAAPLPVLESEI
ncbi:MAG: CoB--CoM heterodisulfide reductase iron-sulfur subunit A family protein [Anaerolineae bacterium]|nr:CoB--CoM heterodisulfide reductase iron-sulfur subunit A family protein [Anaerolineae bacterium]